MLLKKLLKIFTMYNKNMLLKKLLKIFTMYNKNMLLKVLCRKLKTVFFNGR